MTGMATQKRNTPPYRDPVTFGTCFATGSIVAFLRPDHAAISIATGLVLGLVLPLPLSHWLRR